MACTSDTEKLELFNKIRHLLGAPVRKIEIDDDTFCSLLSLSIEDYSEHINNYLIYSQWPALVGQHADNLDISFALITRSLDYERQFTYAYSKLTGNQINGPWELKKDYVEIENGKQVYQIPANREINEVLWITPSSMNQALYSFWGLGGSGDFGLGGGAQLPYGAGYGDGLGFGMGMGGFYMAPAFDVALRAQDFNYKQRMLRSEMIYKVTAGPNGTKLLHLMSTPGSKLSFGSGPGSMSLVGSKVWYMYYDVNPENRDECINVNKDVIKMPNEVPLSKLDFKDLNEPSRIWVRRYLTAVAKETLGRIRGKFGGILKIAEGEVTMDFEQLLGEAKSEKETLVTELNDRLILLSTEKMLERRANEAENLNKALVFEPLKIYLV